MNEEEEWLQRAHESNLDEQRHETRRKSPILFVQKMNKATLKTEFLLKETGSSRRSEPPALRDADLDSTGFVC